jgi:hypothetical protein
MAGVAGGYSVRDEDKDETRSEPGDWWRMGEVSVFFLFLLISCSS